MTRLLNRTGASTPFSAWTTVFYLLLVFIAPFAFLGSVQAQEDGVQENYGTVIGIDLGTTYSYVTISNNTVIQTTNDHQLCGCDAEWKG